MDRAVYYKGGKMLYEITLPDSSRYQEGFDGKVAWQLHPRNGPAISEGDEVKSKERDADMYYPARILDYFKSMEVVEVTDLEEHTCYHLKGINKWGKVNEHFYDTTTGLLMDTGSIRAGGAARATKAKCSPTTKLLTDG